MLPPPMNTSVREGETIEGSVPCGIDPINRYQVLSCERCQSGVSTPISFKENADSKSAVHTSQVSVSGAAELIQRILCVHTCTSRCEPISALAVGMPLQCSNRRLGGALQARHEGASGSSVRKPA